MVKYTGPPRVPTELHQVPDGSLREWCLAWENAPITFRVKAALTLLRAVDGLARQELLDAQATSSTAHLRAIEEATEDVVASFKSLWEAAVKNDHEGLSFDGPGFALDVRAMAKRLYDVLSTESKDFLTLPTEVVE